MVTLTADEIQCAAFATTSVLETAGYTCCLVGSGACYEWSRRRVPNDVDVLVLPTAEQTKSAKEIKDDLAAAHPTEFILLPRDDKPDARYLVLWYVLDDARRCNVDVFVPGMISLPFFPLDRVARPKGLPALPLLGTLLHKVIAWSAHKAKKQEDKRMNDEGDIMGMLELLDRLETDEKGIYPSWFLDEAFEQVEQYREIFPDAAAIIAGVEKRVSPGDKPNSMPPQTTSRVRVTSGDLSSPKSKLKFLAAAHPFTRQIDVVLVGQGSLEATLSQLESIYVKAEVGLSQMVKQAEQVQLDGSKSTFSALSINDGDDDVWCIDPRGILTMQLSASTYQVLGGGHSLVAKKVKATSTTLKGISEEYVVSLPLQAAFHKDQIREKRNAALEAWDARRREDRAGASWDVVYAASDPAETNRIAAALDHATHLRKVQCSVSSSQNISVPNGAQILKPRPTDPDEAEDWDDEVADLFEWVGMAGLGAQRLLANDRVDPYIAVYAPPEPSSIGDATLLRWTGFLPPAFVQTIIDACTADTSHSLVAITCHGFPTAPVAYIPLGKDGAPVGNTSPPCAPGVDAEDTRSILLANGRWCLAESIAVGDARWG
ncbi:hypothetical protein MKEN_01092400 [Mycena kentingensis (nom. inval.)]|nr:hypothetical protein MKEN_01092400 [Mycena kentingensis (nom. inval.)]